MTLKTPDLCSVSRINAEGTATILHLSSCIVTVWSNMCSLSAGNCRQWELRPVARTNLHSQHTSMPSWLTRSRNSRTSHLQLFTNRLGFKHHHLLSLRRFHLMPWLQPQLPRLPCLWQFFDSPARSSPDLWCSLPPRHNNSLCLAPAPSSMDWLEVWHSAPAATTPWDTQWSSFLLRHLPKCWKG